MSLAWFVVIFFLPFISFLKCCPLCSCVAALVAWGPLGYGFLIEVNRALNTTALVTKLSTERPHHTGMVSLLADSSRARLGLQWERLRAHRDLVPQPLCGFFPVKEAFAVARWGSGLIPPAKPSWNWERKSSWAVAYGNFIVVEKSPTHATLLLQSNH